MKTILRYTLCLLILLCVHSAGKAQTLTASISGTNVTCNGVCNGTMTMIPTGGSSPYSYSWSIGGSTATISNLCSGSYTCTVTDGSANTVTKVGTVTQPAALSITPTSTNSHCGNCDGTASAPVSGGTPGYTYTWSPAPGAGQGTANATGLCAGYYTVSVTDANGCSISIDPEIINIPGPTVVLSSTSASCYGSIDGSATATVTGGTAPYTYTWNPSGGTTATVTGLHPNTYLCTVTDANGCSTSKSIGVNQPSMLTVTASKTNVTCNGLNDGSVAATGAGGTPGYTYSWENNLGPVNPTNLPAGTYTVICTDANGCSSSGVTIIISQPSVLNSSISSSNNVSCNGGDNGTADVAVSGGTPGYFYSWTPPPGGGQGTPNAAVLQAGTYTCTITDANGCSQLSTVVITQPSVLNIVTTTSTSESCASCCDAAATVTAGGGTSPYIYSWSCTPVQTTQTATALCSGTYTACISDANGCSVCNSVMVSFNTGIASAPKELQLQVFPNPANDAIQVSFYTGSEQVMKLSILNILGENIYTESITAFGNFTTPIDIQPLPKGLYFLQLSGDAQHTIRFMKN